MRLGRHHRVVPELMGSAAEYPFRENLQWQLMTALYPRAGLSHDARVRLAALERENASLRAERQRFGRLVGRLTRQRDPHVRSEVC